MPSLRRTVSCRRNVLCIVFPSILFGFLLGTYSRSIQQTGAVFMIPGSVGLLLDLPSGDAVQIKSNATLLVSSNDTATAPFDDGYRSPVESMLPHFPNRAIEKEMQKHDRYIVDSLAYLQSFGSSNEYTKLISKNKQSEDRPNDLTIIILTVNRAVPYLAVTLTSLLRGHSPETFVEKLNVHVCNIEKRPDRVKHYHLFQSLQERFPFITFHNWTEKYPELASIRHSYNVYMEEQRRDYVKALGVCKEEGGKWCVILEDDAILPVHFAKKFEQYINVNSYKYSFPNNAKNGTLKASGLMMMKLYSPYNVFGSKDAYLYKEDYSRDGYDRDRAVDVIEAKENGKSVKEVKYSYSIPKTGYGIVSNAYPAHILEPIIDYLKKQRKQQGQPTDTLINFSFQFKSGKTILETTPSLVNHIGYYSENRDSGAKIGKFSTDVRFQIDDGSRR